MALDTQILLATEPGVVGVVTAFGGMAADTGHHLTSPRIEDVRSDGMGKHTVIPMAILTDVIYRTLSHSRMVGAMGSMTVVANEAFVFHRVVVF